MKKLLITLRKKEKLASIDEIYKNTGTYRRLYQAVSFYRLPNPYAVQKASEETLWL